MSLASTLGHVLGIVAGFLIPGADEGTANLTAGVQQELARLYGDLAADMAEKLKVDTTGMSGPENVFTITRAIVATAKHDGFKGDLVVLETCAVDVAQAA